MHWKSWRWCLPGRRQHLVAQRYEVCRGWIPLPVRFRWTKESLESLRRLVKSARTIKKYILFELWMFDKCLPRTGTAEEESARVWNPIGFGQCNERFWSFDLERTIWTIELDGSIKNKNQESMTGSIQAIDVVLWGRKNHQSSFSYERYLCVYCDLCNAIIGVLFRTWATRLPFDLCLAMSHWSIVQPGGRIDGLDERLSLRRLHERRTLLIL